MRQITDAAGLVANSYDYDSCGRLLSTSETVPNPFAFTDRERDPESGLYFYRACAGLTRRHWRHGPATEYDAQPARTRSVGRFPTEGPRGFRSG